MNTDYETNTDALDRARAVAQWELGDGEWADVILRAYFDPDDPGAQVAARRLAADEGDAL